MKRLLTLMLALGMASVANAALSIVGPTSISGGDTVTIGVYSTVSIDDSAYLDFGYVSEGGFELRNPRSPFPGPIIPYPSDDTIEFELIFGQPPDPIPPGIWFEVDLTCLKAGVDVLVELYDGSAPYSLIDSLTIHQVSGPYASNPIPADGEVIDGMEYEDNIYTKLDFTPGGGAVSHEGFFSDDPAKVAARNPNVSLGSPPSPTYPTRYYVGLPFVGPYIASLVRGVTYYWCVDETDALDNTYPGDIWEFTVRGYKASLPNPPNEAVIVGPDVLLSWEPGIDVTEHDVYLGTSWKDVNDAVYCPGCPNTPYLGTVTEPNIFVTSLSENTMYYWRIDEVHDRMPLPFPPGQIYKGDVWCFKTAGLIAHWKFDEGSGNTAYDSAGDNDGTIYGAAWATGRLGSALDFDGVDDYLIIPDSSYWDFGAGDFTISAWVRLNASELGSTGIIVGRWEWSTGNRRRWEFFKEGNDGIGLYVSSDGTESGEINTTTGVDSVTSYVWYHVVGIRNSNTLKIYLDGTEKDSTSIVFSIPDDDLPVVMGTDNSLSSHYFDGKIDEVRIYDRALSATEIEELYNSVPPIGKTYHVDGATGDNTNDGLTRETAFKTIQRGINVAEDYDTVLVWPGVYNEEIGFWGDAITVKSAADAAVVETDYGYAFSFFSAEGSDTVLSNFVIRDSQYGIYLVNGSSPTLTNLTIVNNDFGISAFNGSDPDISNCILWSNNYGDLFRDPVPLEARYSCIEEGGEGEGNISIEPLFANASGGDYHLLSERGRYWPAHDVWVLDKVTSPCIDGGDPTIDPSNEPMPNGDRINMGAYGGTAYASMSKCWNKADINCDGVVDFKDFAIMANNWLETAPVVPEPNVPDTNAPIPDPTWLTPPTGISPISIAMEATVAYDESGVEYGFWNTTTDPAGQNVTWQDVPNYTETGLYPNSTYCYRVAARDKSADRNATRWSSIACADTQPFTDTNAPIPDPMLWDMSIDANGFDGRPREFYGGGGQFDYWVTMRADPDTIDIAPPGVTPSGVEYKFVCTNNGDFSSGGSADQLTGDGVEWRNANNVIGDPRIYTVKIGASGQGLRFRVKARDTSANLNETAYSEEWMALPP